MTVLLRTIRLALPTLFIGYGIAANLSMLAGPPPAYALPSEGLLSGGLTREVDGLYKQDLPHMDLSRGVVGAARYAVLGEARSGALVGHNGWLFTSEETRALPTDGQVSDIADRVAEIRQALRANGTDLVVVPLPAKIDIHRAQSADPVFGRNLEDLLARFASELAERGIATVDARTTMLPRDPVTPAFLATDTHWTPHGAALVADAVAESGLVARGPMTFFRTEAPDKTLTGDLVPYVTTANLAARLGLLPETVQAFVQVPVEAAGDIFGAAPTDIVLVGTSYSANADWALADALMRALGRDVINMASPGTGPLRPMQDYLASASFRDAPPQVVIWEIPIRYLTDPAVWPAPRRNRQSGHCRFADASGAPGWITVTLASWPLQQRSAHRWLPLRRCV